MDTKSSTSDERGQLPAGWKTRMDYSRNKPHGRRMYYNRGTGETSWHRPKDPNEVVVETDWKPATPGANTTVSVPPADYASPAQPSTPAQSAVNLPLAAPTARVRPPADTSYQVEEPGIAPAEHEFAGCCTKFWCVICFILGLVSLGIYIVMMTVVIEFADQRNKNQVTALLASFFGVLAFFSAVMCMLFLVPRYSGHKGVKWIRYKHQEDLLKNENWVWSMNLRGNVVKKIVNVAKGVAMIWLKSAQLFALTYEPVAIEELPKIIVEIGDVVLLDIEKIVEEQVTNSSELEFAATLSETIGSSNASEAVIGTVTTSLATALEFAGGPDAYRNKFYFWCLACVFIFVLVVMSKCCGVLEGDKGERMEKCVVSILAFAVEFAFIPLYHHLLQAFDCTRIRPATALQEALEANGTLLPEWRWDADPSQRCFEGEMFDYSGNGGKPSHLFFFSAGMLAICIMQWPTSFFLMIRPDTYSDQKRGKIIALIKRTEKWQAEMSALKIRATSGTNAKPSEKEEEQVEKRLGVPANRLRKLARDTYRVENDQIKAVDNAGCCCRGGEDSQTKGISSIQHRPREIPIAFCLEATITTVSVLMSADGYKTAAKGFNPEIYERDMLKLKLACMALCFLLLALFYCNPLTLICGKVKCSPYMDTEGTLHRTGLYQMGYPYNWEPLNFFRAATMAVCCAFAAFELLSFNSKFPTLTEEGVHMPNSLSVNPNDAMLYWMYSCGLIVVFYGLCMLLRICIYCRDASRTRERARKSNEDATTHPSRP